MPHHNKKKRKQLRKKNHKYNRYNGAKNGWTCANAGAGQETVCKVCLMHAGRTRSRQQYQADPQKIPKCPYYYT